MRHFFIALLIVFIPLRAFALDVSSPYVKEGLIEIDSKNRFDRDERSRDDGFRRHALSAGYGITRWWALELGGEFEKDPGRGYGFTSSEIESTFQLTTRGEYLIDVGVKAGYQFAHDTGEADEATLRLLLAHHTGRFRTMANINLSKEIGAHSDANPTGELRMMTRYNLHKYINPGLEYYADVGEITNTGSYREQRHRFGPALYGRLMDGVSYETGIAFGITKPAEDMVLKLNLGYEFSL